MKTSVKQVIAVIAIVAIIAASLPIAAFGMAETNSNVQPGEIWDGSISEGFAGGTGTEADPYLISNGAELAYLAQQTNSGISYQGSYFALTNDIYLNDTTDWESWGNDTAPANEWTAIGTESSPFSGSFDGNDHVVCGVYHRDRPAYLADRGLFGYMDARGEIANLGVSASYVDGDVRIGGVVGYNEGIVANCYNTGRVVITSAFVDAGTVGGIVGCNEGEVKNCYNTGSVSTTYVGNVGGVVGTNIGTVINCYNNGCVIGVENVGGVVGLNFSDAGETTVANCHNTGSVIGSGDISNGGVYVGGVVGFNKCYSTGAVFVTNCYNTGSIIGRGCIGGIVGENYGFGEDDFSAMIVVSDCNNMGSVRGEKNSVGGVVGCNWDSYLPTGAVSVNNCCNAGVVIGGGYSIGGVVGLNRNSVANCRNMSNINGDEYVGGVVGCTDEYSIVTDCHNTGSISGSQRIGGVVGFNQFGGVTYCYNTGSVIGSGDISDGDGDFVGGVVGYNSAYSGAMSITNCYNTGSVNGFFDVGGVTGYTDGEVASCYNTGSVIGGAGYNNGGVVGDCSPWGGEVTNCYYLDTCCESGDEYAVALTDEQMQAEASFVGFDFETVWTMEGNQAYPYPELISNPHTGSAVPGDLDGDGEITTIDANMVLRIALYLEDYNSNGDVDNDGTVTLADANTILRWALGF